MAFSELHDILENYGSLVASYAGTGNLILDGEFTPCEFVAAQLTNGDILLACKIAGIYPDFDYLPTGFEGNTDDGISLRSLRGISHINVLHGRLSEGFWDVYVVQELEAVIQADARATSLLFGITNLDYSTYRSTGELNLSAGAGSLSVSVRPVDGYREKLLRVKTLGTVDVTHELVVQGTALDPLTDGVSNLCYVFSLARGTKVQWIYRKVTDESGGTISVTHANRVTKTYGTFPPIDPRQPIDSKTFIEYAFPRFIERRSELPLADVIDSYLDARSDHDFLETRGAKLAITLEMLKNAFLESPASTGSPFVIDNKDFTEMVPDLSKSISLVLESRGVKRAIQEQVASKGKILGLNRSSFRSLLNRYFKHIGLTLGSSDMSLFLKSRNSLIHTGRFYCEAASPDDRAKVPPLPSKTDEYLFLVNILDKIMLRTVGYHGKYLNWSHSPETTEQLR